MVAERHTTNTWGGRGDRTRRPCAVATEAVMRPIDPQRPDTVPIWLAALAASRCQATAKGENHAVRWYCISGRALYTNGGPETELIQPLGVSLQGGQTVVVSWMPGETCYTVEVYGGNEHRA